MTKIGVISDIHGDAQALDLALHQLLHFENVSQVVCLGDLVDKGPHADVVVQAIAASGMVCVMGNHDYDNVHGGQDWLRRHIPPDTPHYKANILSEASLAYLAKLPKTVLLPINGYLVELAHGSPSRLDEYIFANSAKRALRSYLKTTASHALLLGHTHQPMMLWINQFLVANPGSVCGGHGWGSRTFGILSTDPLDFTVHDIETGLQIVLPD